MDRKFHSPKCAKKFVGMKDRACDCGFEAAAFRCAADYLEKVKRDATEGSWPRNEFARGMLLVMTLDIEDLRAAADHLDNPK